MFYGALQYPVYKQVNTNHTHRSRKHETHHAPRPSPYPASRPCPRPANQAPPVQPKQHHAIQCGPERLTKAQLAKLRRRPGVEMDFDRYRREKDAFIAEMQMKKQAVLPQRPPRALTHATGGTFECCECSLEYAAKLGACPVCRHKKCWLCREVYRGNNVARKPVGMEEVAEKPLPPLPLQPKPFPQRPARALARAAGKRTSCCACETNYSAGTNRCTRCGHRTCRLCYDFEYSPR
jgi:hypothetical protein